MLPLGVQEEQAQPPSADQGKGIEMEQDFEGTLEDMPQNDDGAGSEAEDGEEDRLQQVGTGAPMQACHQSQIELQVCAHERTARGRWACQVSSSLHRLKHRGGLWRVLLPRSVKTAMLRTVNSTACSERGTAC